MKFQSLLVLCLLAISMILVVSEPICQDDEGNIIPCKKVIERLEDFKSMSNTKGKRDILSDRDFYNFIFNPWYWLFRGRNTPSNNNNKGNNNVYPKSTKTIPVIKTTTKAPPYGNNKNKTKTNKGTPSGNNRNSGNKKTKTIPVIRTTTKAPVPTSSAPTSSVSGLNIKDFSVYGFRNCNSEQTQRIQRLIEDIKIYRAAGLAVAKDTTDPRAKEIFSTYFKDESTRSKVAKLFEDVNNLPKAEAYCETDMDSACRDKAIAWTYLGQKEFHVCPAFFKQILHGTIDKKTSEAASVVLHELTHGFGTDDYAYGEDASKRLPASQASNNADSYRLFAMHSIYYLNDKKKGIAKFSLNNNIDFRVEPYRDRVFRSKEDKEFQYRKK